MGDEPDYEALQTEPWDIRARPRQGESSLVDINSPLMSDQEIRARALECAVRFHEIYPEWDFKQQVQDFEDYIRNGKP